MRTDKDMALELLANPPRAVLDGFGRRQGEAWETFQRSVIGAAETASIGRQLLRPMLRKIVDAIPPLFGEDPYFSRYDLGPETAEELAADHAEQVRRAETDGEIPFAMGTDGYVGCGCIAEITDWPSVPMCPTAFIVPPWAGPYFRIHAIDVGRRTTFFGGPVPAIEFVERRRMVLPRMRPGDLVRLVVENVDGALHEFRATFWCVPDSP